MQFHFHFHFSVIHCFFLYGYIYAILDETMETVVQERFAQTISTVDLVKYYSSLKTLTNDEICKLINVHHQKNLTPRQLKYIRQQNGIRRYNYISMEDLRSIILNELQTSNSRVGYRQMTEFINLKYNVLVANGSRRSPRKIQKCD